MPHGCMHAKKSSLSVRPLSALVNLSGYMHNDGKINIGQPLKSLQDLFEQGIDVPHFRIGRDHRRQTAQATALDTHLLRVRQGQLIVQHAHRKTEVVTQMRVQFLTAAMTGFRVAYHDLTFGDLHPVGTGTGDTGAQDRFLKRAMPLLQGLQTLAKDCLVHPEC
ncbi:hypothetical protein [Ferrigenium sp. UT5]|uniref:hypothetical protein n=1 Tax=Ferrigenium sp. UT5 TaxID=3242105 RepID=UPI0038B28765